MTGPHPDNQASSDFGVPERVAELIVRYYDQDLSDAGHAELRQALKQSAAARSVFVRWGLHVQVMSESLSPQYREEETGGRAADPATMNIVPDADRSFLETLAELEKASAKAEVVDVMRRIDGADRAPTPPAKQDAITGHDVVLVIGYLARRAARPQAVAALGIAAVVLIAVFVFVLFGGQGDTGDPSSPLAADPGSSGVDPNDDPDTTTPPRHEPRLAELVGVYDAQWSAGALSVGDLLPSEPMTLTAGYARLRFGNGALVSLEAPCRFRPHADGRLELTSGRITAVCETPESKGFKVFTDTCEVIDLGTEFGVERDAQGRTTAGVIRGRVALVLPGSESVAQVLKAGQLARVSDGGRVALDLGPEALQRFRSWSHLSRPVRVTGEAVLIDHMPPTIGANDAIVQVFREATGVPIDEPITVSRTQTGLYQPKEAQQATLQAGARVDSYLVHYDRPGQPNSRASRRFTITFEQPVVALIMSRKMLMDTDGRFGVKGVRYPSGPRGLEDELLGEDFLDSIGLSEDRKTLTISLSAVDMDGLRVLTQSPPAASAEASKP